MRKFMLSKYGIELIFMLASFGTVIYTRYLGFIDNATTGALIGVITGYFLSDIRKIHT